MGHLLPRAAARVPRFVCAKVSKCACGTTIFAKIHSRIFMTLFSSKSGVWERVFQVLSADADNEYVAIEATIVRAHQHSAGAKGSSASAEEIGSSRGGRSTKIHAVVDALGNPTAFF